jgi:endonuclease-3 related protein
MPRLRKKLLTIYERLLNCYGPQGWWPAKSRLEMAVGAILVQSTSWKNVEKAMANLKSEGVLDLRALYDLPAERLERLLRPSGFYKAKTKKLKAFVEHLHHNYGSSLDSFLGQDLRGLRDELLSIYGVGPETADSIILYGAGKPIFVVDAYTHRLFSRIGLADGGYDYRKLQLLFMDNLTSDVALFNEYHALIVRHSAATCRKRPLCQGCVINKMCEFGRSAINSH